LIDPQEYSKEELSEALEKHHIIHFSRGGKNTYDNLLLVCANCHSKIHSRPGGYPVDKLRERKTHWIEMQDVVPISLAVSETADYSVSFSLESVNLKYSIEVDEDTTVGKLALFIRDKILQPLGEYDHNDNWSNPSDLSLALRSNPDKPLNPESLVNEIGLEPDDEFVSLISVLVMPKTRPVMLPEEALERISRIVHRNIRYFEDYYYRELMRQLSRDVAMWASREIPQYLSFADSSAFVKERDLEDLAYAICVKVLEHRLRHWRHDSTRIAEEITHRLKNELEERLRRNC
jgi:hypothetical protein